MWHQLDEVQKLNPDNILEIGPGPGLFKAIASMIGVKVETLDLDPDLKPDYIGSATAMDFNDSTFDVVCAFQTLEHIPYEASMQAFSEMVRISRRNVIISLPDAKPVWRYQFHIPKLGSHDYLVPIPQFKLPVHQPDREHYWEINKQGYSLSRIVNDFTKYIKLVKSYRVPENPYHRFFVFEH